MKQTKHSYYTFILLLFLFLGIGGVNSLNAQEVVDSLIVAESDSIVSDSLHLNAITDSLINNVLTQHSKKARFIPEPMRAMWLALVFPGGGQIYNRKYWKLPIIYGGFLGCAYALTWNNMMLNDYSQAYLDIMDTDPNTKSYEKMLPIGYSIEGRESRFQQIFKNKKNYFRKYRDMSIFAFGAVYLLSVIDAYVDAELSTFDISTDLSLHMEPAIIQSQSVGSHCHQASYGVQWVLNY